MSSLAQSSQVQGFTNTASFLLLLDTHLGTSALSDQFSTVARKRLCFTPDQKSSRSARNVQGDHGTGLKPPSLQPKRRHITLAFIGEALSSLSTL